MEEGAKHLEFLMETAQIWQEEKKEQHRRAHKAQADIKNMRKATNYLRHKEERKTKQRPVTCDEIQGYIALGFEKMAERRRARQAAEAARAAAAPPKANAARAASSTSEALNAALRLATGP